ncbi:P-loop containing nucleoside triphosphate hydrolase protein [Scenedesmus sp. NREL 46B-D3]|nr:P-loop containing nucleoside triphosphate hydrolase protein [Scenedesmus sp. NREL 46B-D3]
MSRVESWLVTAGLPKYRAAFAGMHEQFFLELMMQDFGKYGVVDQGDKHRLYKAIKQARAVVGLCEDAQDSSSFSYTNYDLQGGSGSDLLDLDAHDGDLIEGPLQPFQVSPVGEAARAAAGQQQGGQQLSDSKIRVVVRKRPINKKEVERGDEDVVEMDMRGSCVLVNETKLKVDLTKYAERHQFNFDEALDEYVTNDQVYRVTVEPLVHTLFNNGKATCFAYGQTGSGKTHTMSPLPIRAAADILQYLVRPELRDVSLFVSCFEIYGNKVFDLLNMRKKLNILEDGKKKVCVVGLKEHTVSDVEVVTQLIEEANHRRSVGSTAANSDSSRSHSIMQFALKRFIAGGAHSRLVGKLSFIDLAGSERGADTFDNNRQTRLEGAEINKSLLALKECIRALDSDARHVPFRGSKLTAVLRDSFLGETARTVMVANISPTATCVEHTLNTLRYADRVKDVPCSSTARSGNLPPPNPYGSGSSNDLSSHEVLALQRPLMQQHMQQQQQQAHYQQYEQQHRSTAPAPLPPRGRQPGMPGGVAGGAEAGMMHEWSSPEELDAGEEEKLQHERGELMESILEDEEEIIALHRQQIEDAMEIVRREMAMLQEVDQPGSSIDQYVDSLGAVLEQKLDGIRKLQGRLDRFSSKLKQEDFLNKTVQKKQSTIQRI